MERLEEAFAASYDARSSPDTRAEAQAVCDAFVSHREAVWKSLALYGEATKGNKGEPLRMFALVSCERSLCHHWNDLAVAEKDQVKAQVFELIESGTRSGDPVFILSKIVVIAVEVAKREWPQLWKDFLFRLESVAVQGVTQARLVMGILRDLTDDCTQADFNLKLPPRRRTEIITELRGALDHILKLCYRLLETGFSIVTSSKPSQSYEFVVACAMIKSTFGFLESVSELCPILLFMESKLVDAIQEFAKPIPRCEEISKEESSNIQCAAWSCVAAYARKQLPEKSTIDILGWCWMISAPFRYSPALPPIRGLLQVSDPSASEALWPTYAVGNDKSAKTSATVQAFMGCLSVHNAIAQAVSGFISNAFTFLLKRANAGEQTAIALLELLMDLSARFLCHPSQQTRLLLHPGITAVFRSLPEQYVSGGGVGNDRLVAALPLMFRCLSDHMIKLGHPMSPQTSLWPSAEFSLVEYDDVPEYNHAVAFLRTQTITLLRVAAMHRFSDGIEFLRKRLEIACGGVCSPTQLETTDGCILQIGADVDYGNLASVNLKSTACKPVEEFSEIPTPAQAYLRATLLDLVDSLLVKNIPKEVYIAFGHLSRLDTQRDILVSEYGPHILNAAVEIRSIMTRLLSFDIKNSIECHGCAHALSKLAPCVGAAPDGPEIWLIPVLDRLFSCSTYRSSFEIEKGIQARMLCQSTQTARRRGCTALVDLCTGLSTGGPEIRSKLATLLPDFCQQVLNLVNSSVNAVSPYEEVLLYEVLVLVSNTLPNNAAQESFIADVVSRPLERWSGSTWTALCNDPAAFARVLADEARERAKAGILDSSQTIDPELIKFKRSLSLLMSVSRRSKSVNGSPRAFSKFWIHVLPNVFGMVKTLNSIWSNRHFYEELTFIHPEELRCLVGQAARKRREKGAASFATTNQALPLTQEADQGISFTETLSVFVPNEQQLEDIRIMYSMYVVINFRELVYSALGAAARYGADGIFNIPDAISRIPSIIFDDIDKMEHRHLARFIQAFLLLYIKSCPECKWNEAVFPLVSPLLEKLFQRLQAAWVQPGDNSRREIFPYDTAWDPLIWKPLEDDSGDDEDLNTVVKSCVGTPCNKCLKCCQAEVARDASVRLLGTAFVDLIGTILGIGYDNAKDPRDTVLSNMGRKALEIESISTAISVSLRDTIAHGSGSTLLRTAQLLRQILFCAILSIERMHSFILCQLFDVCFRRVVSARSKVPLPEDVVQALLQVISYIWSFALSGGNSIPAEAQPIEFRFCSYVEAIRDCMRRTFPRISAEDLSKIEDALIRAKTRKGRFKVTRDIVLSYSISHIDAQVSATPGQESFKDGDRVVDLPLPMGNQFSSRKDGHSNWADAINSWDLGVEALFQKK